jgi:hypothetical protein
VKEKPRFLQPAPQAAQGTFPRLRSSKETHYSAAYFFHLRDMLMPSRPIRFLPLLPTQNADVATARRVELQGSLDRSSEISASR